MVKHTKGFKGLSKKVLSAILAASMIMTSSSFVMAAEPTEEPVPVESTANDVETTEVETEVEETEEATNEVATFAAPEAADAATGNTAITKDELYISVDDQEYNGAAQYPEVRISTKASGGKDYLDKGEDYQVTYSNNKEVGTAKATIQFIGDYAESTDIETTFEITPFDLAAHKADVEIVTDEINNVFVYNGSEQYPEIQSVTVDVTVDTEEGEDTGESTITLTADDYDIVPGAGKDIISASSDQRVVVQGKGNFEGRVQAGAAYEIQQEELADAVESGLATITVNPVIYQNDLDYMAVKRNIKVVDNGVDYTFVNNDFTILFYDEESDEWTKVPSVDIGSHAMRVCVNSDTTNFAKDSYVETSYEVIADGTLAMAAKAAKVAGATMEDGTAVFTYTGVDQFVEDSDVNLGSDYKRGVDYEVVTPEAEWIDAGEYAIELVGMNKLAGQTATIPVKIAPKPMVNAKGSLITADFSVEATQGTHPTSGELSTVVVTVTDKDLEKVLDSDDYTYSVVTEDDVQYVEITGLGNYTTAYNDGASYKQKVTVDDERLSLADPSVTAVIEKTFAYTGSNIELEEEDIIVSEEDGNDLITLRPDSDYYISGYENNKWAGTATVTISGKGDYTGSLNVTFEITGTSFADTYSLAEIEDVEKGSKVEDVKKAVKVTNKSTGATFSNLNYSVEIFKDGEEYNKATFEEGGVYSVVVTPKDNAVAGRYEGTLETTVNVVGDDLKDLKASIAAIDDQVYTGKEIKPAVVVTVDKETLKEGEDYTVAYSNNVNAGSADVVVTGINDYSGTIDTTFNITKGQQTIEMTNPLQVRDLGNGSRATNSKNCTLKLGFGLEDKVNLSYSSDNEDVATVANGVITYQGVGECTITVTAKETDNCLEVTLPIKVVVGKVGTPTFTPSVTSKTAAKSITVTSSTVRGADGFEVQYSVRSDWWRASTVDFDGTTNGKLYRQTIKTYHSNKKYYIRVRAYQVVDGAKVYSDWSPAKTATTK